MAKSKEKTKGAKPDKKDRALREVFGILLMILGVLTTVALVSPNAPFLSGLVKVWRTAIGIGVYVMPVILVFSGFYVIGRKRPLGLLILNIMVATAWLTALVHVIKYRGVESNVCFGRDALVAGGGFLSGYPACIIDSFFGVIAGTLVLFAVAIIYVKLAFGISYLAIYEKIAVKLAPHTAVMKQTALASFKAAVMKVKETGKSMAENRKARAKASLEAREKNLEERGKALMEEIKTLSPAGNNGNGANGGSNGKNGSSTKQFALVDDEPPAESAPAVDEQKSRRRQRAKIEDTKTPELFPSPIPIIADIVSEITTPPPFIEEEEQEEVLATTDASEKAIIWKLPESDDWLDPADLSQTGKSDTALRDKLEATLKSFQVPATITNVVEGASFTRFEVTLEPGVKVSRIITLENDIALSLAADSRSIRIEAPIPGKSAVGIEVPNRERAMVPMRKIYLAEDFQKNAKGVLTFTLGEDITGVPVWTNLVKMPHLLVAGSTNSGKSVCINCIITSIIARQYPEDVRFIMMDMKRVELTPYEGIPHLLTPVVKEADVAASALKWICEEMDRRYRTFAEVGVRNIDGYNALQEKPEDKLYRIVVIIDELADLMMVALPNMNVEHHICRITQLARATGIHMILATQRPDTKVITGTIKNNIPTRISFAVPTQIDSRTILDQKGAESLLGRGDMLYMPVDSNRMMRLQGCFVSDKEVKNLVDFWKSQQTVIEYKLKFKGPDVNVPMSSTEFVSEDEALYRAAIQVVLNTGQASISKIQRHLRIGYNRAARLVELMEERGVVGPYDGTNPREIIMSKAGFENSEC